MSGFGVIREIVDTYQKHGWILRRVLLSENAKNTLSDSENELFGDIEVWPSDIDAAWFSRPPTAGETAWELRYLGDVAYALLVYVDENSPEFEAYVGEVEERLAETVAKKQQA